LPQELQSLKPERGGAMTNTHRKYDSSSEKKKLLEDIKKDVIDDVKNDDEYNIYINSIKKYAEKVAPKRHSTREGISTSQIRTIFGELKKINKSGNIRELQKLRMKLAYTGGRGNADLKKFAETLEDIIVETKNQNGINRLYEFVEGVVCYLKFYETRSNKTNYMKSSKNN
jgi:CRISPR type III-A-associated protein Csm2